MSQVKLVQTVHTKKTEYLTPEEFNEKLDFYDSIGIPVEIETSGTRVKAHVAKLVFEANKFGTIEEKPSEAAISKALTKLTHYHKIDEDVRYNITQKASPDYKKRPEYGYKKHLTYYKYEVKSKTIWDIKVASGYTYIDTRHTLENLYCYSYDLNSAFPYAMLKPMPDTRKEPRYNDIIGEGEIGFYRNSTMSTKVGQFAEIIFPLMESPFGPFVNKYYELKKNAADDPKTRKWYKYYLNIATGILALHNIFLRNAVLGYANQLIASYVDDDTVYCNVDCIVSTKERKDIPIGTEIGMFKQEHTNCSFKYKGIGIYQWGNECHYQGIKAQYLTDISDISDYRDNIENAYKYRFNLKTRRFEKCQKENQ